jgi:hypothetical protein
MDVGDRQIAQIDRDADTGIDGRGRWRNRDDRRPTCDRRRAHDHQADKDKGWRYRAATWPTPTQKALIAI